MVISHVCYDKTARCKSTDEHNEDVSVSFDLPTVRINAIKNSDLSANYSAKADMGFVVKAIPFDILKDVKGVIDLIVPEREKFTTQDEQLFDEIIKEIRPVLVRGMKYRNVIEKLNRDALTGLYNRGHFDKDIETLVLDAQKYKTHISCLMIDIDFFKKYNDSYGHQAGDKLLTTVAKHISGNIRPMDRAYRYGGEEFVVLLPDTENIPAANVARRISGIISALDLNITVSIGVSTLPSDAANAVELVKIADIRLYRAKELGRNRVVNN
ncbi:GGDEF domain-containing protein [Candidatus Dojkabacteria bacterium]|nr:GGDEF domain-containing protein [Candidatus Dojkabacteria bacterium]